MSNGLLFEEEELIPWKREWQNMPEFNNQDLSAKFQVIVNFSCAADVEDFSKAIDQRLKASNGRQLQSLWFPSQEVGRYKNKRYIQRLR